MNIIVMIPSLNPDRSLIDYVESVANEDFNKIIVINDGSSEKYDEIFSCISKIKKCVVLSHECNKGKGRALKTGMEYILKQHPKCTGIVTVDADGQHKLSDILSVAAAVEENDNRLVLGSRDFDLPNVPRRSYLGNKLTSCVFAAMFGQKLMDTQTGLRGIPMKIVPELLEINGERYEYEMNMLIECRRKKIEIYEIPIETVYIDNNGSSHFRPVVDSVKIYVLIFKSVLSFIFTSISCTLLDLTLFTLLARFILPQDFGYRIQTATVMARVVSSSVNFVINKNVVFHKKGHLRSSAIKYFCLAVVQMLISANAVNCLFHLLQWHEVIIKVVVDAVLFFINYNIQKKFIFKK